MAAVTLLKDLVNLATGPAIFISVATLLFFLSLSRYGQWVWKPKVALGLGLAGTAFLLVSMLDHNFALIVKKPDNVPIVAMLFLVGFFLWLSLHQGIQNDQRIAQGLPPMEA